MRLLPVLIPLIAAFVGMVGAVFTGVRFLRPGRIPRPRRVVNYRVHYDDSLGTRPDIKGMAELVVRRHGQDVPDASLVMIRLSNEGGLDVGKEHWMMPVSFTFDGRDVVGAELSDAKGVPLGLPPSDQDPDQRGAANGESIRISKGKKALELPKIELNRKDRIRLLVLLSGHREHANGLAVVGGATIKGAVRGGGLVREVTPGRERFYTFGWIAVSLLSMVAAVLVIFIVRPFSSTSAASDCVAGSIIVDGSTAFAPAVSQIAQQFMSSCPSASVAVNPAGATVGSRGAADALQLSGASSASDRAEDLVMSDGAVPPSDHRNLVGHPVAIVIFAVVVNRATGIHNLTKDQLVRIWNGTYTNWDQLGGEDRLIDIVGRDTNSGTRATFVGKILGATTEPQASSEDCLTKDLIPASPVIRCEKQSTDQLLGTVSSIPGAIGYAEAAEASKYMNIDEIALDGRDPISAEVKTGEYPFWAVEYLYTYDTPAAGSLLSEFLSYMHTDAASTILQSPEWADIPCGLTTPCAASG